MKNLVLIINPGSTSTKLSVFSKKTQDEIAKQTIYHKDISSFEKIIDQRDMRSNTVLDFLRSKNISLEEISIIVARGGLLKPIHSGTWHVNEKMINDLILAKRGEHASNLGAIIAYDISKKNPEIKCCIVDPVVVDELDDVARFTGFPEIKRVSIFHALNQKAVARQVAKELKKEYEDSNIIVAHMGGGITVGAHKKGRVIDVNNGLSGEGPMSPERSGKIPAEDLVELCFSGKFTKAELLKKIHGNGGIVSYLNTTDLREVESFIDEKKELANSLIEAMCYQVSKEIGSMASVLYGEVDSIVLTGGLANNLEIVNRIKNRVQFLTDKIFIFPGENEMKALFDGAMLAFSGKSCMTEYV